MTSDEFKRGMKSLGLSVREFGLLFSVNERTVRRWASGEDNVSRWVPAVVDLLHNMAVGERDFWIKSRLAGFGPSGVE